METKLLHVALTDIAVSDTNVMFRDENELTNDALQELIDSVRDKGVIQPVLLRPDGKSKYTLVCGERRFRASKAVAVAIKERNTIPAYIREMTDEEAFELQVTENLERKDVHPLKEAKAYKYILDKDAKMTTAELAVRFAKSETYVLQRLKLNELVDDAKNDFHSGQMSLGHALLLARLTPEDQKEAIKEVTNSRSKVKYYETVHELEDFINEHIVCSLSSAKFKKDDADLIPKAGPCTTCPHRSGASPMLFADIKDKDRCFKKSCFDAKRMVHLANTIRELHEKEPDVVYLQAHYYGAKVHPEIEKVLKQEDIKPLKEYDDFSTWSEGGAKMKGLWVNGNQVGHIATVYSKKVKSSKSAKGDTEEKIDVKQAITRIQERTKRAAELDEEKVYARTIEAFMSHKDVPAKATVAETAMLGYQIYNTAGWDSQKKIRSLFKLDEKADKMRDFFMKITHDQVIKMLRIILLTQRYSGQATHIHSVEGKLFFEIARSWGVPVKQFIQDQDEIKLKREERSAERIKALKADAKKK